MKIVRSIEHVSENIKKYNEELNLEPRLAARIRQHPAWYAIQKEDGHWMFGPSKFVGYRGATASAYLASYNRKDGRDTEPALKEWFDQVDTDSDLGRVLRSEFDAFAERFDKAPNAKWRVSIPKGSLQSSRINHSVKSAMGDRIAFDPDVCGGRARIKGTRMRVTDIVGMLADGAERSDILEDFPYLSDTDISAALAYAANAADHLVLRAA